MIILCTIGRNILFTHEGGRFWEENFLRNLDLCYVNPSYLKLKTFPLLQAVNKSKRNYIRKICYRWDKSLFPAVGANILSD